MLCRIFINNLEKIGNSKKMQHDLSKSRLGKNERYSRVAYQNQLNEQQQGWQMKFTFDKYKVVHIGKKHLKYSY